MKFHSTAGKSALASFEQVAQKGLAPDGGLFMPDRFPKLPRKFFKEIAKLSYGEIAQSVIKPWVGDMPPAALRRIINKAFNFPIPFKKVEDGLFILELFHGPTMAFKDFGARFLAHMLEFYTQKTQGSLNIIVATSGDTGSAVASAFFKLPNIRVFVLYPSKKVSPLQEKQLTTYGHNVTALEVCGTFDDCQKLVKRALSDNRLNEKMNFSTANSINFVRLLPQAVYYFYAYAQLLKVGGDFPVFVTPSGNFGNLFAGLMAKRMGLPVGGFVAATNSNSIVPKYLETGRFFPKRSKRTMSNAMDVGNPSNFVRMLELYGGDYLKMREEISGLSVSDSQTERTIKSFYEKTGYVLDPHTAVGIAAAIRYRKAFSSRRPLIVLSTAHPAKFREMVEPAIGESVVLPRQLKSAMKKKKIAKLVPNKYSTLLDVLLE